MNQKYKTINIKSTTNKVRSYSLSKQSQCKLNWLLLFSGQKASYISISFKTERSLIFKKLMFSILEIVQYCLLTALIITWLVATSLVLFLSANAFGAWLQLGDSSLALESFKMSVLCPEPELRSSCSPLLLEATDLLSPFVSSSDSSWSLVSI